MTETDPGPHRYPHPILFGVLNLSYGAASGFVGLAVPFWLARAGVPLAEIGALSAVALSPHAWKILWIPLIDIASHRKAWYLVSCACCAGLIAAASVLPDPLHHLGIYTVILALLQVSVATSSAALEALMATTARDEDKGRAGGYFMAGNVGGYGVLGALAVWLTRELSATAAGLILAGIVLASSVGGFTLHEPRAAARPGVSLSQALDRVRLIIKDLWRTAWSREGLTGLLICLSPVGAGALTNLFSAMSDDFHAPPGMVETVNGLLGGLVSALGSVVGGYLADRMNRRLAYCTSGALLAVIALAMAASPMTATTYAWGTLGYNFATGIAFGTFAGMVLEMVSHGEAVTTKYTLFVAASNLSISYSTYLDGYASTFRGWGARGTLAFDGILTFAGIALLGLIVLVAPKREALSSRTASG